MLRQSRRAVLAATNSPLPYICPSCLHLTRPQPVPAHNAPRNRRNLQATSAPAQDVVAFRKQLKDELRKKRADGSSKSTKKKAKGTDPRLEKWELTVGIEIHAELNTAKKLFSGAATSSNDPPNTHVALFDAAFPGTQPIFQKETLIPALRAAIALQCNIQRKSSFDRKHYFYPDQPNGYQITQYYEPFATDGHITLYKEDGIAPEDGDSITVGIKQIQMEQDTAKTILQPPSTHLLDLNRVSHPLIEIITLPHIHHPATAAALVRKIQSVLKTVDAVTAGMEMGGLRADVNVSVRERHSPEGIAPGNSYHGVSGLGQRTEIKNLSSFKAVEEAIIAERDRQIDLLESGGVVEGETRGWTIGSTATRKLRGKEGEIDYRYMPDPDLAPVIIGDDLVEHLHDTLPMLPDEMIDMLTTTPYNLSPTDARTLVALDDGDRVDYYVEVVSLLHEQLRRTDSQEAPAAPAMDDAGKLAGNWVLHELGGFLTATEAASWAENRVEPASLAALLHLLLTRRITRRTAKHVLGLLAHGDRRAVRDIVEAEGLVLVPMTDAEYRALAEVIVKENPAMVQAVREKGQVGKVMWFVGQMVRRGEEGRVEARRAEAVVREVLGV